MFAGDAKPELVDELASDIRQIAAAGVAYRTLPYQVPQNVRKTRSVVRGGLT